MTPIQVTERRNLVYNFRSFLSRDTKGHLIAGLYFPVKEGADSIVFYTDGNTKKRYKIPLQMNRKRDNMEEEVLRRCGCQLSLSPGTVETIFEKVSLIMNDKNFVTQILDINKSINGISQDN